MWKLLILTGIIILVVIIAISVTSSHNVPKNITAPVVKILSCDADKGCDVEISAPYRFRINNKEYNGYALITTSYGSRLYISYYDRYMVVNVTPAILVSAKVAGVQCDYDCNYIVTISASAEVPSRIVLYGDLGTRELYVTNHTEISITVPQSGTVTIRVKPTDKTIYLDLNPKPPKAIVRSQRVLYGWLAYFIVEFYNTGTSEFHSDVTCIGCSDPKSDIGVKVNPQSISVPPQGVAVYAWYGNNITVILQNGTKLHFETRIPPPISIANCYSSYRITRDSIQLGWNRYDALINYTTITVTFNRADVVYSEVITPRADCAAQTCTITIARWALVPKSAKQDIEIAAKYGVITRYEEVPEGIKVYFPSDIFLYNRLPIKC